MESDLEARMKEKGLAESSIKLYLRNLRKLNGGQPLKNLTFLKNTVAINEQLADYKPNTVRNYIISIVSVLGLDKEKRGKKKLYQSYADQLVTQNRTLKAEEAKGEKTPTQEANWITWAEVEEKWEGLKKRIDALPSTLSESQYNLLLEFMVLSLYVLLPPRRNDYQNMEIVKDAPEDATKNYLELEKNRFVLNKFKTSKREGQLVIEIPDKLHEVIDTYLEHHPLLKGKHTLPQPFLVYADGRPLTAPNAITRILNKVFGKSVGSSLLRHIYLGKYAGVKEEMKEDAKMMSHTVDTQQNTYVKK
jgi:hypothetical protein